jgi:hypothetical protein
MINNEKPSIYLTTLENSETIVDDVSTLLNNITKNYLEFQRKTNGRFIYEIIKHAGNNYRNYLLAEDLIVLP